MKQAVWQGLPPRTTSELQEVVGMIQEVAACHLSQYGTDAPAGATSIVFWG